jgi:hypothetical protein
MKTTVTRKPSGFMTATPEERSRMHLAIAEKRKALNPEQKAERARKERLTKARKYIGANLVLRDVTIGEVVTIAAKDLRTLDVDQSYQRMEMANWVGKLIAVLEAGGQFPDPITVAVRPDGSRWIVDGQQRWWAHWNCEKPIRAQLIKCHTVEAERTLFNVLNSKIALNPNVRVHSWPGPGGELIRQLDTDSISAIKGEIDWSTASGRRGRFGANIFAKSVVVVLSGALPRQSKPEDFMPVLDNYVRENNTRAVYAARGFAQVWQGVVQDSLQPMPRAHVFALALACTQRWIGKKTIPEPTKGDLARLRQMNWFGYAPDGKRQFIPLLRDEILKRWRD